MTIFCTLIIVASIYGWCISRISVKNAFFNGDLQEEVYMVYSIDISYKVGDVCKFTKDLYGLKQVPCARFEKFPTVITFLSFSSRHYNSTLFYICTFSGCILLYLYVDDMVINGQDMDGSVMLSVALIHQL